MILKSETTPSQAAKIVGIALLLMVIFAVVGLLPLLELIEFGNEIVTKNNINDNKSAFTLGIIFYFIILILDIIVAFALYIVLKPAQHKIALATMAFRLAYTAVNLIAVISLALLYTSVYDYTTLIAYFFFIIHLFVLGYATVKSGYIPKWIGIFVIIASFSYLVTTYGEFVISENLYDILYPIAMVPASLAELTLGLYLLIRNSKMPESTL